MNGKAEYFFMENDFLAVHITSALPILKHYGINLIASFVN